MDDETEYTTEEALDQYAQQAQQQAEAQSGYPTPPTKESVFRFFKELLDKTDSSKFGNLSATELGLPQITVRGYQSIALDAEKAWGLDKVGKFLRESGEQTLATSLSKKGFLAELFVTQIRREKKGQPTQAKTGIFGWKKKGAEPQ